MKTKQEILVNVLSAKLQNAKVGVIVRGITDINPVAAIDTLSHDNKTKYYVSAVGYSVTEAYETDMLTVCGNISRAFLESKYTFIAEELNRQDLYERIKEIIKVPTNSPV